MKVNLFFFLNGKPIGFYAEPEHENSTAKPYFAVASLGERQQCFFNFGQQPFTYDQKKNGNFNFHTQSGGNAPAYWLLEPFQQTSGNNQSIKIQSFNCNFQSFAPFVDANQEKLETCIKRFLKQNKANDAQSFCRYIDSDVQQILKQNNGFFRLGQAVINVIDWSNYEKSISCMYTLFYLLFSKANFFLTPSDKNLYKELLQMITSFTSKQWSLHTHNWIQHQNVCFLFVLLHELSTSRGIESWNSDVSSQQVLIAYFLRLINTETLLSATNQHSETVLWALIALKKSIDGNKTVVLEEINKLEILLHLNCLQEDFEEKMEKSETILQILHITENLKTNLSREIEPFPLISFCSHHLTVRNDRNQLIPVRSKFSYNSGVHYFEVRLVTSGSMRFGWCQRECEFKEESWNIGQDLHSIAIDSFERCVWHNQKKVFKFRQSTSTWKAGDTVGCLIDFIAGKFAFYFNGIKLKEFAWKGSFARQKQPLYYAALALSAHQQVRVDFQTEVPLCYRSEQSLNRSISSMSFSSASYNFIDDNIANELLETVSTGLSYWPKQALTNDGIQLFSRDSEQAKIGRWVEKLNYAVEEGKYNWLYFIEDRKDSLFRKITCPNAGLHLVQSFLLVDHFQDSLCNPLTLVSKLSIWGHWIKFYLCSTFTYLPSPALLFELLYPLIRYSTQWSAPENTPLIVQRQQLNMLLILNALYEPYKIWRGVHLFTADIAAFLMEILYNSRKTELFSTLSSALKNFLLIRCSC